MGQVGAVNNPLVVLAAVDSVFPSFAVCDHFTCVIFVARHVFFIVVPSSADVAVLFVPASAAALPVYANPMLPPCLLPYLRGWEEDLYWYAS